MLSSLALLVVGVLSYCLGRFVCKSNERSLLMMLEHRRNLHVSDRDDSSKLLAAQQARIAELESAANVAAKSLMKCFEVKS